MTPKERAVQTAIAAIEKSVRRALDAALPQIMNEIFDAGGAEYAASLQRAMQSINPIQLAGPVQPTEIAPGTTPRTPSKDGRAPRGSVRKAVVKALIGKDEGLTMPEIMAAAAAIDPSISGISATNELNRKKGQIYSNEDGRWRLIPGLKLGGDYYDLLHQESQEG